MKAHNLDKLSDLAKGLIAAHLLGSRAITPLLPFLASAYMIEVKLDRAEEYLTEPLKAIEGGNLKVHFLCRHRYHAEHLDDPDWAVIHEADEDWDALDKMVLLDRAIRAIKPGWAQKVAEHIRDHEADGSPAEEEEANVTDQELAALAQILKHGWGDRL